MVTLYGMCTSIHPVCQFGCFDRKRPINKEQTSCPLTPKAHIYLDTNRVISPISPMLFSGFAEHMGRAIYEGIYDPASPHADERASQGCDGRPARTEFPCDALSGRQLPERLSLA